MLGQNSELQHRWLTVHNNIVEASNLSSSQLEDNIDKFTENHANEAVQKLINGGKLDFDSVRQFREHDKLVFATLDLS